MFKTTLALIVVTAVVWGNQAMAATSDYEKEFDKALAAANKSLMEKQKAIVKKCQDQVGALYSQYKAKGITMSAYLDGKAGLVADGEAELALLDRSYFTATDALVDKYFAEHGSFASGLPGSGKGLDQYRAKALSASQKASANLASCYADNLKEKHTEAAVDGKGGPGYWTELNKSATIRNLGPVTTYGGTVTETGCLLVGMNESQGSSSAGYPPYYYNDRSRFTGIGVAPGVSIGGASQTIGTKTISTTGVDGTVTSTSRWLTQGSGWQGTGNQQVRFTGPNGAQWSLPLGVTPVQSSSDTESKEKIKQASKETKSALAPIQKTYSAAVKSASRAFAEDVGAIDAANTVTATGRFLGAAYWSFDHSLNDASTTAASEAQKQGDAICAKYEYYGMTQEMVASGVGAVGKLNSSIASNQAAAQKVKEQNVKKLFQRCAKNGVVLSASAYGPKPPAAASPGAGAAIVPYPLWISGLVGYVYDGASYLRVAGEDVGGAAGQPVVVKAYDAGGTLLGEASTKLLAGGMFETALPLPAPGSYMVQAFCGDHRSQPYSCVVPGAKK